MDATSAARAAICGLAAASTSKDGASEASRVSRITRGTAIHVRGNALRLLRMSIGSAPDEVRD